MDLNTVIRRATPMDAEEILEYSKQVGSQTSFLSFGKDGLPYSIVQEKLFISNYNSSSGSCMLVATHNNKIIGVSNFITNINDRMSHRGEIGISVLKDYWGKGVAKKLLDKILDFARSKNIEIVSLDVISTNTRAINFYKKFGFTKYATYPKYAKIENTYLDADMMILFL